MDTREIPKDRGVGSVRCKSVCDAYDGCLCVCVCEASREGEQMPAGHVISLTLGAKSMAAEPMETKRRQLASSRAGCWMKPKYHFSLYFWFPGGGLFFQYK